MFVPNLSEAAAVRLIETILFGRPLKMPTPIPTIRRWPRCSPRAPPPLIDPFAASNADFFRSVVLHKRVVKTSCSQVTPVTPVTPAPAAYQSGFVRRSSRPPRPPHYFEDGRLDPSNCGGGDRGLPSFGPARCGAGRGRAHGCAPSPAPFRQQFFDGDHRGRGQGIARRDVPHVTWQDTN